MSKTALQQFIEWGNQMIQDNPMKILSFAEAIDVAEELLQLEKDQIIDAYNNGKYNSADYYDGIHDEEEQYYQKTYGEQDNE